jgi:hypothetical protein
MVNSPWFPNSELLRHRPAATALRRHRRRGAAVGRRHVVGAGMTCDRVTHFWGGWGHLTLQHMYLLLYLCKFIYIYIYIYICVYDIESLIHSLIHSLKIQTYSFPFIHELTFFHLQHLFVVSFTCCRSICHVNLSFLGSQRASLWQSQRFSAAHKQSIYYIYIYVQCIIYTYIHQIPNKMLGKMWCNTKIPCKLSEHVTQKMNTCQIECHIKCENVTLL